MALSDLSRSDLQDIVTLLDQALHNHTEWYRLLTRALVCQIAGDQHDLSPNAHKQCRFGQWYYNTSTPKSLEKNEAFMAIGKEHQRMHHLAAKLLEASQTNTFIPTYDYDNFANSSERLQLEIFALKHELEGLIYTRDPLTSALNRIDMLPILREHKALLKRNVYKSSYLVMMDLDHFSEVNNTYGHAAGDKVLMTVVHYVIKHLRPYDKVFRYGGEEFLLLVQDIDFKAAHEMIERLRKGIQSLSIKIDHEKTIHVTACFGLSPFNPNTSIENSIELADKAVYAAKSAGRNRVKTVSDSH